MSRNLIFFELGLKDKIKKNLFQQLLGYFIFDGNYLVHKNSEPNCELYSLLRIKSNFKKYTPIIKKVL